jgi:hypothetical protein
MRRHASVFIAVLLFAATAHAQESVEELKKRGNQAMMDLRYAEAIEAYRAALAVAPDDASLYYNLGRAEQAREDYPAAADALAEFARRASPEMRARVPKLDELVADVNTRIGTIDLRCSADATDATVVIGERVRVTGCTTTPKPVRISLPLRHGTFDVRLEAATLQAQDVRIALDGGAAPKAVLLTVLPKSASGKLVVNAKPATATVSVDGVVRGNPPLEIVVGAGAHEVDVNADGHEPAHRSVLVDAGTARSVDIDLAREAPLTSKWWFWTAVGAVVVTAAVVTVVLVVQPEKDPHSGSNFNPGNTTVSLVRF